MDWFKIGKGVLEGYIFSPCLFFIFAERKCQLLSHADSLQPHGLQPTRLLCPWTSMSNNTGVGSHPHLQRIFPTQGLNHISCIGRRNFNTESLGKLIIGNAGLDESQAGIKTAGRNMCVCVCVYHIFFIHSSIDGHLSCFQLFTIVNTVAMNIEVHICS